MSGERGGGLVSFVGAGPGDPAHRTERAAARIARADRVVRDVDALPVADLVALARAGARVVRLIEGDVRESERAIEELRAVARAGVPCEVAPGLGAEAVALAFAGVVARAVRVAASEVGRAVAGEPAGSAVTLVARAGEPTQRVVVTSARLAAAEAGALGEAELVLGFGEPEEALRWFERRPLFGKRVLVTRARDQAGGTAALLREHGAEPRVVPTIAIEPPTDPAPLGQALADLRAGAYAWVAFTSANGVERTWDALVSAGGDARAFGGSRLAAIGPATARALERHGLRADVIAEEFRGEGLAAAMLAALTRQVDKGGASGGGGATEAAGLFGGATPLRVLVARAAKARDVLPDALRAAGCRVDVVAAYETRPPGPGTIDALLRELDGGGLDAVTFTSSSTVDHLCELLGPRAPSLLANLRVASIGPITTESARARGLRVDVTASEYTVPGLIEALAQSWA